MGVIVEEIGRYDTYTYNFTKNTTTDKIEVGTDGNLYRLSVSNGNEFLSKDKLYTKADIEAILDKIRIEVDELDTLRFSSGERIYKDEVFDIIDKYKAGSEE
jgi:hypothetical protein